MLNRVDHVGGRIAETVTEATLAKLEIAPATLKERLKSVDARLEALLDRLEVADIREDKAIATQIAELNGNLKSLNSSAAIIGSAGPDIAEAALRQAGQTLTDAALSLRGCRADKTAQASES